MQSQSRHLKLDVGLNECPKQWKGKSGAEVQSEKFMGSGKGAREGAEGSHCR